MDNVAINENSKPLVVKPIRKIFSVYIQEKEYDVYDVHNNEKILPGF